MRLVSHELSTFNFARPLISTLRSWSCFEVDWASNWHRSLEIDRPVVNDLWLRSDKFCGNLDVGELIKVKQVLVLLTVVFPALFEPLTVFKVILLLLPSHFPKAKATSN